MEIVLTYRGRQISQEDAASIPELIDAHPSLSRRRLSVKLCELWDWYQANGAPRDMVCRSLMLALHRAGHIELPAVRCQPNNPLAKRRKPKRIAIDSTAIEMDLKSLGSLTIEQVRRTPNESLLNSLLEMHHYLGYTQPVGEQLKYMVFAGERPVACFTWSSAARHLRPRDRFIGWSKEERQHNIRFIAYNSRFLIMPWVKVPHLASHLLGRILRRLSDDWNEAYGHPVHFAETFIHPEKFRGTCYLAANWTLMGQTTGRGKDDLTHRQNRPIKDVLGYPLTKKFRKLMSS